jgi:hypothetical protein
MGNQAKLHWTKLDFTVTKHCQLKQLGVRLYNLYTPANVQISYKPLDAY